MMLSKPNRLNIKIEMAEIKNDAKFDLTFRWTLSFKE